MLQITFFQSLVSRQRCGLFYIKAEAGEVGSNDIPPTCARASMKSSPSRFCWIKHKTGRLAWPPAYGADEQATWDGVESLGKTLEFGCPMPETLVHNMMKVVQVWLTGTPKSPAAGGGPAKAFLLLWPAHKTLIELKPGTDPLIEWWINDFWTFIHNVDLLFGTYWPWKSLPLLLSCYVNWANPIHHTKFINRTTTQNSHIKPCI